MNPVVSLVEDPTKTPPMTDDHFLSSNLIDVHRVKYPHSIVWTPIPLLTWLFPFVGHMGIARTDGVIRDFAGPYYVSVRCCSSSPGLKIIHLWSSSRKTTWPSVDRLDIFNWISIECL